MSDIRFAMPFADKRVRAPLLATSVRPTTALQQIDPSFSLA